MRTALPVSCSVQVPSQLESALPQKVLSTLSNLDRNSLSLEVSSGCSKLLANPLGVFVWWSLHLADLLAV